MAGGGAIDGTGVPHLGHGGVIRKVRQVATKGEESNPLSPPRVKRSSRHDSWPGWGAAYAQRWLPGLRDAVKYLGQGVRRLKTKPFSGSACSPTYSASSSGPSDTRPCER